MKAVAVSPATKHVGIADIEEPVLRSATEVRVRILEVGVCGTDKEICRFDYGTPPGGSDYLVLGHEALGVVEDAGAAVTRVKQGDLFANRDGVHAASTGPKSRVGRSQSVGSSEEVP